MKSKLHLSKVSLLAGAAAAMQLLATGQASACGGFFCNTSQPVNQAAERIVFSDNGDGTVTAVIQIQYSGPADKFAWLLPIPTAPKPDEFKVASDAAFARLQALTNPQYTLTTRVEGACREDNRGFATRASADGASAEDSFEAPGVNVEASGSVGPFDWEVISVEEGTDDPAKLAVTWLGEHDYAVPESTEGLVAPYLEDGLFLLAVKLTKTASTGSIRPIVITYAAERAMIPVRLTSVAADDDMGVMTWLLGEGRGVPENYLSLELNEARLNWFNANSNYNQVVIEAANDAGGQGFVTEYAGDTAPFEAQIWYDYEEEQWTTFKGSTFVSLGALFSEAFNLYASYDGFWDAVQASVTLSQQVSFENFKLCPDCYLEQITFAPAELMAALEQNVIDPMRVVQDLIDMQPNMTRLYTTLSADEMTVDPLFTFNAELDDVSNLHTAERVIECNRNVLQFDAPWRIQLSDGDVVHGTAQDANSAVWPSALDGLPPNRRITRQSNSGTGKVLEDNADKIELQLSEYNDAVARKLEEAGVTGGDDGCSLSRRPARSAWGPLLAAAAAMVVIGRRRR